MDEEEIDPALLFHAKCYETLNNILEESSRDERRNAIRTYIENLDSNKCLEIPNFGHDWEWFNVTKQLSFDGILKGKVVVLDFFTYCCINCMHILPDLEALEAQHEDADGLAIIGVHSAKFDNEKISANILSAILRYDIRHPVVNDVEAVLWRKMAIQCWPTLVIVNPHGQAIFSLSGEGHRDMLIDFVSEALRYYGEKDVVSGSVIEMKLARDNMKKNVLQFPGKVCCTSDGKLLAIADTGHHRIILTDNNGIVKMCIGGTEPGFKDGCFKTSQFHSPQGVCFRGNEEIYVADTENHAIRKIDLVQQVVSTLAGTGVQGTDKEGGSLGPDQPISSPWDVAIADDQKNVLLIAMAGTHQIWTLFLADRVWIKNSFHKKGTCIRFAGSGNEENRNNNYPHSAAFAQPSGLCVGKMSPDSDYNTVFVADSESSTIRALSLKDGSVKALVGGDIDPTYLFAFGDVDGRATKARLQHPLGVGVIPQQGVVLVADSYNHKIKLVNPLTRSCTKLVGSGQPGGQAGLGVDISGSVLNEPGGLAVHPDGDKVYIADTNNHCIKLLSMASQQLSELPIIFVKKDTTDQTVGKPKIRRLCPKNSTRVELECVMVTSGQELTIQLYIGAPENFGLNTEAPSKWALFSEDDELDCVLSEQRSGDIDSISHADLLTVTIPHYTAPRLLQLQAECSVYMCGADDMCYIKPLIFTQPLEVCVTQNLPQPTKVISLTHNL